MRQQIGAVLALCAVSMTHAAWALEPAWVSWVMDGDTVLLVPEGEREPFKLRIQDIDAPETCQPGGERARDALMALVLRRQVWVQSHGLDSYGRHLGRLRVGEQDVGEEMVRLGWAWAYRYRTGRGPYAALQRQAERERRGLFGARESAMSPGVFRQFHGPCHGDDGAAVQAPVRRIPQTGQAGSR